MLNVNDYLKHYDNGVKAALDQLKKGGSTEQAAVYATLAQAAATAALAAAEWSK